MPSHRLDEMFRQRRTQRAGAFLPFFTAGFPRKELTTRLILSAAEAGASVIELGEPFSDSIADGPVIQESFHEALRRGHRLAHTFAAVSAARPHVQCGIVAMVSYSIVHRIGLDRYLRQAAGAGFDGLILPDVPAEEAAQISRAAQSSGLAYIGLVAPTTSSSRCRAIVAACSGFVYQVAVTGTTGERDGLSSQLESRVEALRRQTELPICVGFGVATAEQVRAACRVADGVIVGSAIVRRLVELTKSGATDDVILEQISGFLRVLAEAAASSFP